MAGKDVTKEMAQYLANHPTEMQWRLAVTAWMAALESSPADETKCNHLVIADKYGKIEASDDLLCEACNYELALVVAPETIKESLTVPPQGPEVLYCTGCGARSDESIDPSFVACCPDSRYRTADEAIKDLWAWAMKPKVGPAPVPPQAAKVQGPETCEKVEGLAQTRVITCSGCGKAFPPVSFHTCNGKGVVRPSMGGTDGN